MATDFTPGFYKTSELVKFNAMSGIDMQTVLGGDLMANWVHLDSHTTMPMHDHENEQLGIILEGRMELTVDGTPHMLTPGDVYTIPGGVAHGAQTFEEGCVVLDVFTPPREAYAKMAEEAAAEPSRERD